MSAAPKTVTITGAAQDVGKVIPMVVVDDSAAQKPLLDDLVSEITRIGRTAIAVTAYVSVEKDVEDLVAQKVSHFGSTDIMVANDGIATQAAPTISDSDQLAMRLAHL
ncbi:hypothetical protein DFS33DRAFT_1383475 [Desarmillaria ectypa]|nr:hypothetical protein DFS33DRAFT_1383475 [Desarmillaria ectypa]